ncbi:uncharacterized protein LOC108156989 isoform X2 [Drosophila miranda]|uniref:uncharacterized protein LOC108156989 isoform X2 n=1 Tax=Drosophila miranda TaxID=7229 RepID=UPI00143F77A8|nr:uncharacterized protein LOC108156989 isoform X2 [Drosophila miranda]
MLALINRILDWFKSIFWKEEMELTLVGLQFSGKTTFVNVIARYFLCSLIINKRYTHVRNHDALSSARHQLTPAHCTGAPPIVQPLLPLSVCELISRDPDSNISFETH